MTSGVFREASGPGDLAFPQVLAPAPPFQELGHVRWP